ncbi:hypothetical protein [Nocardioides sp. zg-1230]|uniref:hypothetical protein n=1 Tax=Nocardioides sp. zg-1230 TaxID=2736601 RepID=UPI0015569091|nr:hypothetical protein [Nocardioides sp. zg-1230]NPC43334.1 hypothetical protein [Nocardioides sp. zg-1230]NPC44762.1 hypothetical protein [Nocardioides sp. zg-1230]
MTMFTERGQAAAARRSSRTVVMMAVCVVLAGVLSSCGQEGRNEAVPMSDREENDVPLNAPTLRFHVSTDGQVGASPDLEAEAGEVVAMVLENESDKGYELRLVDPAGNQVFAVDAPAGELGDGRAMPRDVGTHVVSVFPVGRPAAGEEFPVAVSET